MNKELEMLNTERCILFNPVFFHSKFIEILYGN